MAASPAQNFLEDSVTEAADAGINMNKFQLTMEKNPHPMIGRRRRIIFRKAPGDPGGPTARWWERATASKNRCTKCPEVLSNRS